MELAILATGPSMKRAIADSVGACIVVNDAFRFRPDALALCANDQAWWNKNKDALGFKGRKFSTNPSQRRPIERVTKIPGVIGTDTNSALIALHVALTVFKASRVLLYGVDMSAKNGAHYFGPHQGLSNTTPNRFGIFMQQFTRYRATIPAGVEVFNATPGSALQVFPFLVTDECRV